MMNKDEAVQKLATAGHLSIAHAEDLYDSFFEKPVVPQYVADWYEEHKDGYDYELWDYFSSWDRQEDDDFKEWIREDKNQPILTLVSMHQFGYEVEKETKYRIKMKAARYNGCSQFLSEEDRGIFWGSVFDCRKTKFTRKELESNGFGWVFDCPGVEVKEVDDGND